MGMQDFKIPVQVVLEIHQVVFMQFVGDKVQQPLGSDPKF